MNLKYLFAIGIMGLACLISGCFTLDSEHNDTHIQSFLRDLHYTHEDIDHVFMLNEHTPFGRP